MFMPQPSFDNGSLNENVCWLVPQQPPCTKSRYKSPWAAKVRWDSWAEKKGCCKTIGPPPKLILNCPDQFLRKHSRQVPVFFSPEELRVTQDKEHLKRFVYQEPYPERRRRTAKSDKCPFYPPPYNLGLFRSPHDPSDEQKYRLNKATDCPCDRFVWEDLIRATECAGVMAARMEKEQRRRNGGGAMESGPVKDFIRSNAVTVIRMPPRRLKRCYVDPCGVHLIDMSDSPYVLRPGFGKVPPYIYRRKMELLQNDCEAKRRLQVREQAGDQEGIQLVDEREKQMVIQGLKDYWADLLNQYNSLPLNDTGNERHRELKHGLEERMKEVEQDLRLLNNSGSLFVGDVKESRYL